MERVRPTPFTFVNCVGLTLKALSFVNAPVHPVIPFEVRAGEAGVRPLAADMLVAAEYTDLTES